MWNETSENAAECTGSLTEKTQLLNSEERYFRNRKCSVVAILQEFQNASGIIASNSAVCGELRKVESCARGVARRQNILLFIAKRRLQELTAIPPWSSGKSIAWSDEFRFRTCQSDGRI